MKVLKIFTSIVLLLATVATYAQLATPQILSSNMVLQQGKKVPIWGTALPKEALQISFEKQVLKIKADAQGKWYAELEPLKANKNPQTLTIKGKKTSLVYDNILIGEVWFCSGQSNMEYTMKLNPKFAKPAKGEDLAALELQKPANPMIRVFNCNRDTTKKSTWKVADGESLAATATAGYFFGKNLLQKLDVPVGIITSAIGGTRIEGWTSKAAYEKSPIFGAELKANQGKIDDFSAEAFYKFMIAPLAPFAVKGFLWYQGENNCGISDKRYAEKFQVMVNSWRELFKANDAPFYYVLLAPHIYSDRLHKGAKYPVSAEELPSFWLQQIKAQSLIPNTDYVIVSDLVDNLRDIHPSYKWEVGGRLARLALAKNYGKDTLCLNPRLSKSEISGDSIVVSFENCGKGLQTKDKKRILWFEIAGSDGVFHAALADIRGTNQVRVFHPDLKKPVQVRFCFHETAMPNLINSEGLPANPFVSK